MLEILLWESEIFGAAYLTKYFSVMVMGVELAVGGLPLH